MKRETIDGDKFTAAVKRRRAQIKVEGGEEEVPVSAGGMERQRTKEEQ